VLLLSALFFSARSSTNWCGQDWLWDLAEEAYQSLDVLRSRSLEELLTHELQSAQA